MKELKVKVRIKEYDRDMFVVESGEGIERSNSVMPMRSNKGPVESGEGIESYAYPPTQSRPTSAWNPVKELKVRPQEASPPPFSHPWNPVKELKVYSNISVRLKSVTGWNSEKELKDDAGVIILLVDFLVWNPEKELKG